jgi:8-oxo-dGTP pyrophosphatase MutT (NUDIX family)
MSKHHFSTEQVIPVVIDKVIVENHLGKQEKHNQQYHNILVMNIDDVKYIENYPHEDNYIRTTPIVRCYDENVIWPDHPLNINGKIQGCIIIIKSTNNKILLVRNGKLWGLPKGARNYKDFMECKKQTDEYYRKHHDILIHETAVFTDDRTESPVENVCRETLEETGIIINTEYLEPLLSHFQINNYCAYDGFCYMYPKDSTHHSEDLQQNGTDHENDELLWVTIAELKRLLSNHRSHNCHKVFNHITYGFLNEYINHY